MRFYTLPPGRNYLPKWPYLLVNPKNWRVLLYRKFEHAILDCGVEYFAHNPTANDYPTGFLKKWLSLGRYVTKIFGDRVWVTIPDYPDDYHPGQFGDNVQKTLDNLKLLLPEADVNWLPSVQAAYLNRLSFHSAIDQLQRLNPLPARLAVGTVCKTRKLDFIKHCLHAVRTHFPNHHIHAFGLTIRALPDVKDVIDSFDSLAFTYPLTKLAEGYDGIWGQARNLREKQLYFERYSTRIEQITRANAVMET